MSFAGSLVGAQEGIEAGLVTSALAATEQHPSRAIALGVGMTAVGVIGGHYIGENALSLIDQYIGNGGVGFVPAVAIGSSVAWHNTRKHKLQDAAPHLARNFPFVAGMFFAAFEGVESGILTSSTQTSLLYAEAVTLTATSVAIAVFGGIKTFASKVSPKNAFKAARALALAPTIYLGAKATPELIDNPKVAGVAIAALGTAAVGSAIGSFFRKSASRSDSHPSSFNSKSSSTNA
jgi:hypothetical protein